MVTVKDLVREARALMAAGLSVSEVQRRLAETSEDLYAELAVKKALADRWAKPFDADEEAILKVLSGWVSPTVLAGALGRTRKSMYMWKATRRPGARGEVRCAHCGSTVDVVGFPEADAPASDTSSGSLDWVYRCSNCGRSLRFRLSWVEVI